MSEVVEKPTETPTPEVKEDPKPIVKPEDTSGLNEEPGCLGSFHAAMLWALCGVPSNEYAKVLRRQRMGRFQVAAQKSIIHARNNTILTQLKALEDASLNIRHLTDDKNSLYEELVLWTEKAAKASQEAARLALVEKEKAFSALLKHESTSREELEAAESMAKANAVAEVYMESFKQFKMAESMLNICTESLKECEAAMTESYAEATEKSRIAAQYRTIQARSEAKKQVEEEYAMMKMTAEALSTHAALLEAAAGDEEAFKAILEEKKEEVIEAPGKVATVPLKTKVVEVVEEEEVADEEKLKKLLLETDTEALKEVNSTAEATPAPEPVAA